MSFPKTKRLHYATRKLMSAFSARLFLVIGLLATCGAEEPHVKSPRPSPIDGTIVEDFGTAEIHVSRGGLRALHLTPASTPDEVRTALLRHSVDLAPDDRVCLWQHGTVILIKSHDKQWTQLEAFLDRLEKEKKRK